MYLKIISIILFAFLQLINGNDNNDENPLLLSTRSLVSTKNFDPLLISEFKLNNLIISDYEFKLYENSIKKILNPRCVEDLNSTLWGVVQRLPWAIAMYDSSVKTISGIETGSVYQIGNFDECININDDHKGILAHPKRIKSKYCLADVTTNDYHIRNVASRKSQVNVSTIIHWGICVPASCELEDVEIFLGDLLGLNVHVDDDKCYMKKPLEATRGMIIYGCIILCFVLMTLLSTIFHLITMLCRHRRKSIEEPPRCLEMLIKSFSVIENMKKLFQKSHDNHGLNSINGVKAILMFLIIGGHSLLFVVGGPVLNSSFLANEVQLVQNAFLLNSVLFVDTFLLLSGFLFCRILLRELEKRQGKINVLLLYIFRYIRLTPAYLAVIGFYITWLPVIGSGPLWNHRIGMEQKRCESSWWLNIFYINNYFGTDNLCMFQSWYLSADTQLFILAPIVIYLLWKNRKAGVMLLGGLGIFTTILPVAITYLQDLDPTLLIFQDEVADISSNNFFLVSYIKTHMRATGYVFGLMTGFILHYMSEKAIKIPRKIVIFCWIFSTIIGIFSMFSVTYFYVNMNFSTIDSSIYAGLHRFGWSLSTSWLIIASTTGNCGFLEKILSSRFFAPLSRLTYCSYLTNGLVELYMAGSIRSPIYMDHINLLGLTMSHASLTLVSAVIICLLFESPIHGIERILLRQDTQRQQIQRNNKNDFLSNTSDEPA